MLSFSQETQDSMQSEWEEELAQDMRNIREINAAIEGFHLGSYDESYPEKIMEYLGQPIPDEGRDIVPQSFMFSQELIPHYDELRAINKVFLVGGKVIDLVEGSSHAKDEDYVMLGDDPNPLIARGFIPNANGNHDSFVRKTSTPTDVVMASLHDYERNPEQWRLNNVSKRDFTICGLLYSDGALYDPTGHGLSDIRAKRLQTIGHPEETLNFHPLRILRALKYMQRGYEPTVSLRVALLSWKHEPIEPESYFYLLATKLVLGATIEANLQLVKNLKQFGLTDKLFNIEYKQNGTICYPNSDDDVFTLVKILSHLKKSSPKEFTHHYEDYFQYVLEYGDSDYSTSESDEEYASISTSSEDERYRDEALASVSSPITPGWNGVRSETSTPKEQPNLNFNDEKEWPSLSSARKNSKTSRRGY